MGNMCFSGNKDRVGDQGKEKPGQEKPVTTTATEEKPAPSLEEVKPPVPEEKPVSEAKPEEKPVEDKPEVQPVLAAATPASKSAAQMAGDHGNIQIINNAAAWKAKLEEAKNAGKIMVVDFTATWCGPCRLMAPIFTELSKKFESLLFLKVDVDEVQDVTAEWQVRAMPTFLFIKDGKELDKLVGANKDELERKCNHHASTTTTVSSSA